MIIELELGSYLRVLELAEFGVLNGNERVFRKNVLDISFDHAGLPEQACVIEPNDVGGLIGAITQFQERSARVERHSVFHAR